VACAGAETNYSCTVESVEYCVMVPSMQCDVILQENLQTGCRRVYISSCRKVPMKSCSEEDYGEGRVEL